VLGGESRDENNTVKALGGLYVIGTQRNESPRIDRQLCGRAGRQGDPGSSIFFISVTDPLYRQYGLEKILPSRVRDVLTRTPSKEITVPLLFKKADQIQHIIDGQNYLIRQTLINYSHMVDQQRLLVRHYRMEVLLSSNAAELFSTESRTHFQFLSGEVDESVLQSACRSIMLWHLDNQWCEHLGSASDLQECACDYSVEKRRS